MPLHGSAISCLLPVLQALKSNLSKGEMTPLYVQCARADPRRHAPKYLKANLERRMTASNRQSDAEEDRQAFSKWPADASSFQLMMTTYQG
jgi:hypothetical protein